MVIKYKQAYATNKSTILTILSCLVLFISNPSLASGLNWLNQAHYDLGLEGNDSDYYLPKISATGQFVSFISYSSNLIADDNNGESDVFLKNLATGEIRIINTNSNGEQSSIDSRLSVFSNPSANGRYVAFTSYDLVFPFGTGSFSLSSLYIKDTQTGQIHTALYNGLTVDLSNNSQIVLSANGQYVYFDTFDSLATNDTNFDADVYRYNRATQEFELISIDYNGNAVGGAYLNSVSNNGRFVDFTTDNDVFASPSDIESYGYVRDLDFSSTFIYSVDNAGTPVPVSHYTRTSVVSNAGMVYFCSDMDGIVPADTNGLSDIYVYNNGVLSLFPFPGVAGSITDVSCFGKILVNNDDSQFYIQHASDQIDPSISTDTTITKIYYINLTTNHVKTLTDNENNALDVELFNKFFASNNLSELVFLSDTPNKLSISGVETTQPQVVKYNHNSDSYSIISTAAFSPEVQNASILNAKISDNQNLIVYSTEANNVMPSPDAAASGYTNTYLLNRNSSELRRIATRGSVNDMSPNGRYVVFNSEYQQPAGTVLLDGYYIFLYDRIADTYTQICKGHRSKVNNDGNVVLLSIENNLVVNDNNGENDVFFFEKSSNTILLISKNSNGFSGNDRSNSVEIGGEGVSTWLVFSSLASDLIASDVNGREDVFMMHWPNGQIQRISETGGVGGDGSSGSPYISNDTTTIAYVTNSDNLIGQSTQGIAQNVVYDRVTGNLEVISLNESGQLSQEYASISKVSSDGRYITFQNDDALLNSDTNNVRDIYLYDRQLQQLSRITQYDNGDDYAFSSTLFDFNVNTNQNPPLIATLFKNKNILNNDVLNLNQTLNSMSQLFLLQSGGNGETLSVTVSGNGTVTGNLGFNCTTNCSQDYVLGQTVTLVATPDSGFQFSHWQGDTCNNSTTNSCSIYINQDMQVEAIFTSTDDIIFTNSFE